MTCVALSVLQRVAACCGVLQCVVVCCSLLQYVAVCCGVTYEHTPFPSPWGYDGVSHCCSVLQYVAVCCSDMVINTDQFRVTGSMTVCHNVAACHVVLQRVAACCGVP